MLYKSALILTRGQGPARELLLTRKRNEHIWKLPGGCGELGENPQETLAREIQEKLSCQVGQAVLMTCLDGSTPDGMPFPLLLFQGRLTGEPVPSGEIVALRWARRADLPELLTFLTPIVVDRAFPFLQERGLW